MSVPRMVALGTCVLLHASCDAGAERAPASAPSGPDTVLRIGPLAEARDSGFVLLDSARVDVTQDGRADRIELWVQAQLGRAGRVLWEDGHSWRLHVRSEERTYRLLDRFIPWATVRYAVVAGERGSALVVSIESSTAGVEAETYRYDPATATFVREAHLRAEGRLLHAVDPAVFR